MGEPDVTMLDPVLETEPRAPVRGRAAAGWGRMRALASALRDRPLVAGTVACGEIGLTGELRPSHGLARRLREAARLGFTRAIVPRHSVRTDDGGEVSGIDMIRVGTLREAIAAALVDARERQSDVLPTAVPVGGGEQ